MSKAYDEIMEQIKVTEEMQERILSNIRVQNIHRENKIVRYRKVLTWAAAGLLLLLTVTSVIPRLEKKEKEPETGDVFVSNGIETCNSVDELSKRVGFSVTELTGLPFSVKRTEYLSYWDELAEIDYEGENEKACYRKSKGTEDNSGDYNEYKEEKTVEADGFSVVLKGEEGSYQLAVWQKDGYSYSLSLEKGANAETFVQIAENNQ